MAGEVGVGVVKIGIVEVGVVEVRVALMGVVGYLLLSWANNSIAKKSLSTWNLQHYYFLATGLFYLLSYSH